MAALTPMTSLQRVSPPRGSLEAYRGVVDDALIDEILRLGRELKGVRVLQLNSTAVGGGVAELLNSLVPLELDCGLSVEWRLLCPDDELFAVTKSFHNALQGQPSDLQPASKEIYLRQNQHCAAMLEPDAFDAVIVHDPQPAAIPTFHRGDRARWVWRCHIDSSRPDPAVWGFLRPHVERYDAAVFTMPEFVPVDFAPPRLFHIPPAIDPLSPKNRPIPEDLSRAEVAQLGVDVTRPLLIQVARFDPWKDPLGAIDAYRRVKSVLPDTQFALIGSMATDDPEGWQVYESVREAAGGDTDIHLLTNLNGVGAHEVNAFQRVADAAIQKSIREGFGLVVSEAVWKGTPVVGGDTGGIPLQIQDGVGGFLVKSVEECAERSMYLLRHPEEADAIAQRGKEHIRQHFLTPRLLRDELRLIQSVLQ